MRMDQIKGAAGDMSNSMASPLKHFTNAKKKINGIFVDISSYIDEFGEFVDDVGNSKENLIINEEIEEDIYSSQEKIDGIKDILARDHMKVVFFGRTSNGKSTVINAMLRDKILPSGIGHTTNCFLSVAGTNEGNGSVDNSGAYLLCDGSDERMSIESVSQLGHALSNESLASDSLIQLFWPKSKCALLKDEVVFVDSPGIDVTSDLDRWIDKYCRDADVFVLVANAESTLMLAEKNFFHRVNEKLSKPNIFILNNRWDASASEPESMEQVRQQHLERGVSFLSDELKVVSKQQAKDRVFFVSAKEALQSRIPKTALSPGSSSGMAEGHQARMIEFAQFEHEFEECISKSATRTKFDYHAQRAIKIVDTLYTRAEWIHTKACELLTECKERRSSIEDRLIYIDNQLQHVIAGSKAGITQLAGEAENQVRSAMTDEIKRLTLLVDEFKRPFHPNPMVLRVYKAELYRHVEDGLGRNLSARCSAALQKKIDKNRGDMIEAVSPLIMSSPMNGSGSSCVDGSSSNKKFKQIHLPSFPSLKRSASTQPIFDMSYDIDCASLCADFQEDIDFRFSLGFSQLMARFIGPKEARRVRMGGITADKFRVTPPLPDVQHPQVPTGHEGPYSPPQPVVPEDLIWNLVAGYFKLTQSHSAIFIVVVGMVPYFFYRSIGWKAIAFSAAGYCALYGYERMTWTSRAKERALKRQFVEHATDKLNLVISFTSSNCSHQVQQELSSTFAQLCSDVDQVREILKNESDELLAQSKHLQKTQTRSKTLRNKAGWLASELDSFSKTFLAAPPIYNNGNA